MRILCKPCNEQMALSYTEEMGATYWCKSCGIEVNVNYDKDTIEVDLLKKEESHDKS